MKKGRRKDLAIGSNQMNQSKLIEDNPILANDIDSGCNCFSSQIYDHVMNYIRRKTEKGKFFDFHPQNTKHKIL